MAEHRVTLSMSVETAHALLMCAEVGFEGAPADVGDVLESSGVLDELRGALGGRKWNFAPEPDPDRGNCPADCTNTDMGTCPLCHEATGAGCNHGLVCDDCAKDAERRKADEPRPVDAWIKATGRTESKED